MNRQISIYQQIVLNAIPVMGYWFLGWSMFAIIYLYWVEAVIISLFVFMKIAMARGPEADGTVSPPVKRVFSGFKILFIRIAIMMFYWVFILLFVAMGQGQYDHEQTLLNLRILAFVNPGFNLAILAFFLSQIIEFIGGFINTDKYKTTASSDYKLFFDARTIVIHVVVVLGTFAYQFLAQFSTYDNRLPGLGFVFVMFFMKTMADIFIHKMGGRKVIAALTRNNP
jgi:hypothetical protein